MDEAGRPARRRRGAALESAIVGAAAELLEHTGYAGMTMDEVARRAGTNKNAIYRRYPDRLRLGVEAYRRSATAWAPPDTGSLRSDALTALRRANRHWDSALGRALRELMAAAASVGVDLVQELDPEAAQLAFWSTIVDRAARRGEVPSPAPPPRAVTSAIALLRHEFLVRGGPEVDDAAIVEIVDLVYLPLLTGLPRAGATPEPG